MSETTHGGKPTITECPRCHTAMYVELIRESLICFKCGWRVAIGLVPPTIAFTREDYQRHNPDEREK